VRYQWDIVDGYMEWFRLLSHPMIQNSSNRYLAPGHPRVEDVNAIVLTQVIYYFITNSCNILYMFVGFSNILFIFTTVNRSCQDDCRACSRTGAFGITYCVDPILDVVFNN